MFEFPSAIVRCNLHYSLTNYRYPVDSRIYMFFFNIYSNSHCDFSRKFNFNIHDCTLNTSWASSGIRKIDSRKYFSTEKPRNRKKLCISVAMRRRRKSKWKAELRCWLWAQLLFPLRFSFLSLLLCFGWFWFSSPRHTSTDASTQFMLHVRSLWSPSCTHWSRSNEHFPQYISPFRTPIL